MIGQSILTDGEWCCVWTTRGSSLDMLHEKRYKYHPMTFSNSYPSAFRDSLAWSFWGSADLLYPKDLQELPSGPEYHRSLLSSGCYVGGLNKVTHWYMHKRAGVEDWETPGYEGWSVRSQGLRVRFLHAIQLWASRNSVWEHTLVERLHQCSPSPFAFEFRAKAGVVKCGCQ